MVRGCRSRTARYGDRGRVLRRQVDHGRGRDRCRLPVRSVLDLPSDHSRPAAAPRSRRHARRQRAGCRRRAHAGRHPQSARRHRHPGHQCGSLAGRRTQLRLAAHAELQRADGPVLRRRGGGDLHHRDAGIAGAQRHGLAAADRGRGGPVRHDPQPEHRDGDPLSAQPGSGLLVRRRGGGHPLGTAAVARPCHSRRSRLELHARTGNHLHVPWRGSGRQSWLADRKNPRAGHGGSRPAGRLFRIGGRLHQLCRPCRSAYRPAPHRRRLPAHSALLRLAGRDSADMGRLRLPHGAASAGIRHRGDGRDGRRPLLPLSVPQGKEGAVNGASCGPPLPAGAAVRPRPAGSGGRRRCRQPQHRNDIAESRRRMENARRRRDRGGIADPVPVPAAPDSRHDAGRHRPWRRRRRVPGSVAQLARRSGPARHQCRSRARTDRLRFFFPDDGRAGLAPDPGIRLHRGHRRSRPRLPAVL
ncbi:hypothetical protein BN871_GA_00050 [Paenibacillus sp. P22]|nr:hypothetical protein BN871_GA_00050 [Paenibacillus sp. P22]